MWDLRFSRRRIWKWVSCRVLHRIFGSLPTFQRCFLPLSWELSPHYTAQQPKRQLAIFCAHLYSYRNLLQYGLCRMLLVIIADMFIICDSTIYLNIQIFVFIDGQKLFAQWPCYFLFFKYTTWGNVLYVWNITLSELMDPMLNASCVLH
jgi:hypothetical protein